MASFFKWLIQTVILEWLKELIMDFVKKRDEAKKQAKELEQAMEELKKAQTDEEIFNAQEKIVKLKSP